MGRVSCYSVAKMHWMPSVADLRVESLLKTDSEYPRNAGVLFQSLSAKEPLIFGLVCGK